MKIPKNKAATSIMALKLNLFSSLIAFEPKIKDIAFHNDGTIDQRSILWGQSYTITKGMRFAQLVLKEVPTCVFYDVEDVKKIGFDRAGGFGSSGVK